MSPLDLRQLPTSLPPEGLPPTWLSGSSLRGLVVVSGADDVASPAARVGDETVVVVYDERDFPGLHSWNGAVGEGEETLDDAFAELEEIREREGLDSDDEQRAALEARCTAGNKRLDFARHVENAFDERDTSPKGFIALHQTFV